ncbi:polysaccharide biosynthesis tyrosine autokinase [Calothrix sp. PCC 7507]|uniref:GumC family protein n=1 Tax=Calothrix sp. PCC 7507 TaxID=99598 RepID=UPI00029F08D5|nr:polysaccharide biosynthesis tyrosine autokinase [Calothrix sp. PCC 7507]AFY34240.1 capsular exopolysaccharide family [Calothrix sp. PCC 7507]
MENNSSQFANSDQKRNALSQYLQTQFFPVSEEPGNDWNFQEFLSIVRRRSLVISGVATVVMITFLVGMKLNQKAPEYKGSFRLLVEPVNEDTKVLEIVKDPNIGQITSLDYESQIQVLKSPEMMGSIIKRLQAYYPDITYDSLNKYLTIIRLDETKIIEVSYRSQNPHKIKFVLDRIAQDYIKYSSEKRQTKLTQGIKFVEKQLPLIQNRVDRIQQELQIFRQKYDFIDPETQASQITVQVSSLSEQRQKIDRELAQARSNLAILQEKDGEKAALNNAVLYQQLLIQIRQLDAQIATESTRLQEENPSIQILQEKRKSLLLLLNQEAKRFLDVKFAELLTQVQTLEVQSQEIAKVEQKLEEKRKQLPILARQYTELQRKFQISTESLNRFLSTRENLQIQISQTKLGWQLIQAPNQPQKPVVIADVRRNLLVGLGMSLASGIGIALLMEKFDKTYHNIHALKENIKLPLLGNIPFEQQVQNSQRQTSNPIIPAVRVPDPLPAGVSALSVIPNEDYSNYSAQFLEALRVLCTNIQLLNCDRPIHSIITASAMPGDGKSTIAFHLAQIATAMGQRVLLVDANLRQPVIHTLSDLNNLWGLSNLISSNLPIGEVIQQLPSMNQLSVITAGAIPLDPTKLLSSDKMKQLMADFHDTFDLVIYDVPPLLKLADANLLAPHTDGILLVVRIDQTNSSIVQRTLDNLTISPVNVLGVVGNGQKSNVSDY